MTWGRVRSDRPRDPVGYHSAAMPPSVNPPGSERAPLRVGVLGAGSVGREVIRALLGRPESLAPAGGRPLELAAVAVRDVNRHVADGIPAWLLTDAPAPEDQTVEVGSMTLYVERGLEGLVDIEEPHDRLVLRPLGSAPNPRGAH